MNRSGSRSARRGPQRIAGGGQALAGSPAAGPPVPRRGLRQRRIEVGDGAHPPARACRRSPPPGRSAQTSGGVRSSRPSQNGQSRRRRCRLAARSPGRSRSGGRRGAGGEDRAQPGELVDADLGGCGFSVSHRERLAHPDVLDLGLDERLALGDVTVARVEGSARRWAWRTHLVAPVGAAPRLGLGEQPAADAQLPQRARSTAIRSSLHAPSPRISQPAGGDDPGRRRARRGGWRSPSSSSSSSSSGQRPARRRRPARAAPFAASTSAASRAVRTVTVSGSRRSSASGRCPAGLACRRCSASP